MKKSFTITYKKKMIRVEADEKNIYHLKYPDFKFLVLDHTEEGWVVEDRSGDYWTDEDITALSRLIEKNEPVSTAEEEKSE
jgi:hypothetical protein